MADQLASFGGTLAGGIQDISALLTLIGTEQCEKHIGSALEGGFLYVAATVLSIFGSLGIVKAGIAVLIASLSIAKPSISFRPFPELSFSSGRRLLGARVLKNAGFQLPGTVSPRIGLDASGQRYMVEAPLLEKLEEKHLNDADKLSVVSKSAEWNVGVILSTTAAVVISGVPYIHLFLKDLPNAMHALWVFPFLRAIGSCVAAVSAQFVIQSRIVSIMKNRIIFMAINQLHSNDLGQLHGVKWDENLPAEECLESLRQCIRASHATCDLEKQQVAAVKRIRDTLLAQYKKHFFTRDRLVFVSSWIFLLLGIPATITGYIGCFTLITNSTKPSGPLIWLALEATLSILRVLLWTSNPRFDEKTQVTVLLEHAMDPPPATSEKLPLIDHIFEAGFSLPLAPEREFLQYITPYIGPLDRFSRPENVTLYYTWSGRDPGRTHRHTILCITVLDTSNQTAFTLAPDLFIGPSHWYSAGVDIDSSRGELQAVLRSEIDEGYLERTKHESLINSLVGHYRFLLQALNRPKDRVRISRLRWTWSLLPIFTTSNNSHNPNMSPLPLSSRDQFNLRSYEHNLKTKLMHNWGEWIVDDIDAIARSAYSHCYLTNSTCEKVKLELERLEAWLLWEWVWSELTLLKASGRLEVILYSRMKDYIKVANQQDDEWLEQWLELEFQRGQWKRLRWEREQARKRMEEACKAFNERLEEGQLHISLGTKRCLEDGPKLIDQMWRAVIWGKSSALEQNSRQILGDMEVVFAEQLDQSFEHWKSQRENERLVMEATIERIRNARFDQLDQAYRYPQSSRHLATAIHSRFLTLDDVILQPLSPEKKAFAVKLGSAIVYDVNNCGINIVRDVVQKSTTRSVIGVSRHCMKDIPDNNHLLYVSGSEAPEFVGRNRERWWQQAEEQNGSSWTFYFSPEDVDLAGQYVFSGQGTIAHVMVFIQAPTRIRLRLVHCRNGQISISVREPQADRKLRLHPDEISEHELRLQDVELDLFEPGRHELELFVEGNGWSTYYCLQDILVEFLGVPRPRSSDESSSRNAGKLRIINI